MIAASYMGHYEIVEILLENGADVNNLDIDGRSALCVAALCGSSGYSRVISILLEYNANADQQGKHNLFHSIIIILNLDSLMGNLFAFCSVLGIW